MMADADTAEDGAIDGLASTVIGHIRMLRMNSAIDIHTCGILMSQPCV